MKLIRHNTRLDVQVNDSEPQLNKKGIFTLGFDFRWFLNNSKWWYLFGNGEVVSPGLATHNNPPSKIRASNLSTKSCCCEEIKKLEGMWVVHMSYIIEQLPLFEVHSKSCGDKF